MKRSLLLAVAVLLGACTFQPGTGFGTLRRLELTASLDSPAARYDSTGHWKTDNDARLAIETLQVDLGEFSVQGAASVDAAAFDPANPPPGYSLCHNGHCHRSDGALVDYEEIRAELAGGKAAPPLALVRVPLQRTVMLGAAPVSATIDVCGTGCVLDRGTWRRASVGVVSVQAAGSVMDGLPGGPIGNEPRRWRASFSPSSLSAELPLTIDRRQAPDMDLRVALQVSQRLFDGLPWAELATQTGDIDLAAVPVAKERLLRNFAESSLRVSIDHRDK